MQFGHPYGVTNAAGQVPLDEASRIIRECGELNPCMILDTAAAYGESEAVLGRIFNDMGAHDFRVVTKCAAGEDTQKAILASLDNLGLKRLYGLLDHNGEKLLSGNGQKEFAQMRALRERGVVEKIGASVYTAEEIDGLIARYDLDIIQVPLNIMDQRLIRSGHLRKMKDRGIEVHVRSVFLQGILLGDSTALPAFFSAYQGILAEWEDFCWRQSISKLAAALSFVGGIEEVDSMIVGVTSLRELEQVMNAPSIKMNVPQWQNLQDDVLLSPAKWRLA